MTAGRWYLLDVVTGAGGTVLALSLAVVFLGANE